MTGASGRDVLALLGRCPAQIGMVVHDLDRVVDAHADSGPWSIWTYDRATVSSLHAAGAGEDFAFRIALNRTQPQLEFIQPLSARGPYSDWLRARGQGVHHLGFLVEDVDAVTEEMRAAGFEPLLSGAGHGADGTGAFCYFDTVDAVGYVTEAITRPRRRREPDELRHLADAPAS